MTPRELAIDCVKQRIGAVNDNIYRAEHAFLHYSPEAMLAKYRDSDETPTQILAGYREWKRELEAALLWVIRVDGRMT
jgi:hypothetical protein